MVLPVQRRYTVTFASAPVVDVFTNMTDDESNQDQFTILTPNLIIDMVNAPDPDLVAFATEAEIRLTKNGQETPVRAFTSSISPTSSGRVPLGPVNMSAGSYIWKIAVRVAGSTPAATTYSMLVKYQSPIA